MNKEVTMEKLTMAIFSLIKKVDEIEKSIKKATNHNLNGSGKEWMNILELCEYLPTHPARQTVYEWVKGRIIPYHKNSKMLIFNKSEIDAWLHAGYRKTIREIESDADNFVNSRNK